MSITANTKTWNYDTQLTPDATRYQGPAHTYSNVDLLDLKRTAPKPTADFGGMARGVVKLNRSMTDGTDLVAPGIIQMTWSVPRDADPAEVAALLADYIALVATQAVNDLYTKQDINH